MKPVSEVVKEGAFIVLTEGAANNSWFTCKGFLHLMHFIMNRGGNLRTHLYIFNPATNKDAFIGVSTQKSLNKMRKTGYNATRKQFSDLAGLLGVPWEPMFAAYIEAYLKPRPKYSWNVYPDTWLEKEWSKLQHAEIQCDSV